MRRFAVIALCILLGGCSAPGIGEKRWEHRNQYYTIPESGPSMLGCGIAGAWEAIRQGGTAYHDTVMGALMGVIVCRQIQIEWERRGKYKHGYIPGR